MTWPKKIYQPTYLPTYVPPLENTLKEQSLFETLITILTIENLVNDNLCYLTINCDTGQHSQFLRCFSYELLHWREVLHIWSVNWDPVENQVWIENNCSKSRIHTISVKCDIVRVWRRHWFDDTTQFTFICNHLKIDTEPQQVCTRKWIADEGSDTFLGQTFDNRKWWPDSSQRASEQASLK